jgi:isocitrate dehydrogenase
LATCAFLPVIRTFTRAAGVRVESSDISVAARILGNFPST